MDYRKIEKLETCPYNSSHQILPHRMAMHIIKCKKNYPNAEMKVCIFNAVHVVPTHQYQAHLLECENRELVERELYRRPQVMKEAQLSKVESAPEQDIAAKFEDWESECVVSSYSPEKHIIYKEFTRPPKPGLSKGARKQWRLSEIERVNRLKSGMMVDDSQNDRNTTIAKMTNGLVNAGCAGSGAVPKAQDKLKCNTSGSQSAMLISQMSHEGRHTDRAATIFREQSQDCSFKNHIDESKESIDTLPTSVFMKEKRKLEKKLFEIKKLENMKMNLNEKLTEQEESKILIKKSIEEKLASLMASMDV